MSTIEQYLIVGIDPAGIGTTGIVIKTYNGLYPRKWYKEIIANNPVTAANEIIEYIGKIKEIMDSKGYGLKEVIVEMPHGGIEKFKEVKATRELVGILRFYYERKFKGHLPNHKDKSFLEKLKPKLKSSHLRDAEAILNAHINEKEKGWSCESAWLGNLNEN